MPPDAARCPQLDPCGILAKTVEPESNHEETIKTNLECEASYKALGLHSSKESILTKSKLTIKKCWVLFYIQQHKDT